MENSKIEWTDHTFNPWVGCTKVSPACDNCYAESWAKRTGQRELWHGTRRRTSTSNWGKPVLWNKRAAALGIRYRVFCASLADVFDNQVPYEWRADLFRLIEATPNLDWLLLTKRIGNARDMGAMPDNVWLGATVVNQEEVDRDLDKLLDVQARVRFLSMEPLLGPVDLYLKGCTSLHWVIVGGESGAHARTMPECWALDIRDQCERAGVAFFMKQGSAANWPRYKEPETWHADLRVREFPVTSRE